MKIAVQVACYRAITPGTFLLASLFLLAGCSKVHQTNMSPLDTAGMLGAGLKESSVLAIVRLDLLAEFAGEAQAMRLAGISDDVVLNIARRRAKGETVISGSRLAGLRNVGYSNVELVAALDRGITDKQAQEAIARHTNGPRTFVHQAGRRR